MYRDYPGAFLPVPDPDDTWDAIQEGQVFGCLDENGRLVAVGGIYLIARALDGGDKLVGVHEMGGMVVHPDVQSLRPHGLQMVLASVRIAYLAAEQRTNVCLIASVARGNGASLRSMEKCGFAAVSDENVPLWLRDVRRTWRPETAPDVVDHVVGPPAMTKLFQTFQTTCSEPLTKNAGREDASQFAIRFEDHAILHSVLSNPTALDGWSRIIPNQRMIGREAPFFPWHRTGV